MKGEGGYVAFGSDIVKKIAEKRGIPVEEVQEMVDLNIRYIEQLVDDPEVTSIHLGKGLGRMVANEKLTMAQGKMMRDSNRDYERDYARDVLFPRYLDLKAHRKDPENYNDKGYQDQRYNTFPFIYRLKKLFIKHHNRNFKVTTSPHRLWKFLAKLQNEITEKLENGEY